MGVTDKEPTQEQIHADLFAWDEPEEEEEVRTYPMQDGDITF